LSLKLSSLEKIGESFDAVHYYSVPHKSELANENCRHTNIMYLYAKELECEHQVILENTIVSASGINITTKPYLTKYYDHKKMPQIFGEIQYYGFVEPFKYSSPVFKEYKYPNIIYCLNLERVTVAETNMWTKYVPMDIWGLVGLCFFLLAVLNPTSQKIKFKFLFQHCLLFVSSFLKLMGTFWRQSWSHKWKLLGVLELLFSTLICVYENSITVNVVKPLVPKPFLSTKELYNNNYTFVVQKLNFYITRNWLLDEYNRRNHHKIIEVEYFFYMSEWLERYLLNHHNDVKYAIVGYLNFHFHYQVVKFVKEKNDTCYQMFPTEKAFSPQPFYFHFTSAVASSLHTGVSRLGAAGFLRVFEACKDFRENLVALAFARPLAAEYENELTYEEVY